MRKTAIVFLEAALLATLSACGNLNVQSTSYSKPREGETIETLAVLTDPPAKDMAEAAAAGYAKTIKTRDKMTMSAEPRIVDIAATTDPTE